MKNLKILPSVIVILVAAMLLSGCAGGSLSTNWSNATIAKDMIYISNQSGVFAVNLSDGSLLKRFPEKAEAAKSFYAAPAVAADGTIVVGDFTNSIYGINPDTMSQKWVFSEAHGRFVGSPIITGSTVLAPCSDHYLYALNLEGKLLWKYKTGEPLWASPVSDGKWVYQPGIDRNLHQIDLATGKKGWITSLGGAAVSSPLLTKDGMIYLGTTSGVLLSIDASSGKILHQYNTRKAIWTTPVLKDEILYFGTQAGSVIAVDTRRWSEAPLWEKDLGSAVIGSGALLSDGVLFPTQAGQLVVLGLTNGEKVRSWSFNPNLYANPLVNGDKVVVISTGEKVMMAFDSTGKELWSAAFVHPK
ncbi:MAG TPA: PQQ-binding-like beta-propeller repeat protein [Anaerolineaceae bacterium]